MKFSVYVNFAYTEIEMNNLQRKAMCKFCKLQIPIGFVTFYNFEKIKNRQHNFAKCKINKMK